MSFWEAVDYKNGLIRVCVAVLHKLTTERNQKHFGSLDREFSQWCRNAQGGTTADGRGNSSAAWDGAFKLRKQTVHFNIDIFISSSLFQNNQQNCRISVTHGRLRQRLTYSY